ncbi:MAG TPA: hypothetical protein VN281_04725 [Verrucomicrobiae bacterium]|nr:hypothetical protein [Verrucomicrobiae bacterium]
MKLLAISLIMAVAAGIGLAAGFVLRTHSSRTTSSATGVSGALTNVQSQRHGLLASVPIRDDSPLATKLERDLAMSTGVTRWLCWLEAMEKASPSDFPRLVRLARNNPAALRWVANRWAQIDPRSMFDALVAVGRNGSGLPDRELSDALFNEWPKKDPEAAIAALNETAGVGDQQVWRDRVATAVIDNDAERGLRLFSEWHIENYGPNMGAVSKWAAVDPRHAAEFALQYPAGYASQMAMETIGKEWAKTDPSAALQFAAANPGQLSSDLAAAALKAWAGRNLNDAADWLAATDDASRNRLSPAFVETWAKQDSAGALAWCDQNLTGSHLVQAEAGVLKGAADKDVTAAATLVTSMDPSPARAEAAASVAQKMFPDIFSDNGSQPIKPETLAWVAGLDPDSIKRVLDQVTWNWSARDPQGMAAFLSKLTSDEIPTYTDSALARQMAREHPLDALNWANSLPLDRGLTAGADAYSEWRLAQPEDAAKWLNDLPATDPRRQPFFESAIRSLAYGTQAVDQFSAMPDSDRAAARAVVQSMGLPDDRRTRLLAALAPR